MNRKLYLKPVILAFSALVSLTACVDKDDWSTPPMVCNNKFDAPNISLADFKAKAPATGYLLIENDQIFDGYIVSSDENGNFYKTISFQDKPVNPTAAMQIEVDKSSNYADFPVGAHIRINAKGLRLGLDRGVVKIGSVDATYAIGRIPNVLVSRYVSGVCNGTGDGMDIASIVPVKLQTLAEAKDVKYLNMLVSVPNVQFADSEITPVNKTFIDYVAGAGADTDRNIVDAAGNTAVVRSSGFFTGGSTLLPKGSGDITFVASRYNTASQMIIRSLADVNFTNARFTIVVPPVTGTEAANFMFKGADFEVWNDFISSINSQFGIKSYATQGVGLGRNGSNALQLKGTPTANDYVFTAIVNNTIPAAPKKITFYVKGKSAKSLSLNVSKTSGTPSYTPFNVGDLSDQDVTLNPADANQYTGTIDTKDKWVLVTLNVAGLDIQKTAGKDLFSLKTGSNAAYDLVIDNIKIE